MQKDKQKPTSQIKTKSRTYKASMEQYIQIVFIHNTLTTAQIKSSVS